MTTIIHADRLIDGTGAAALDNAVLVIDGERVVGAFPGRPPDGLVPEGAEMLDLPGCTILPGLVDVHVHLNLPGDGTLLEDIVREPDGVLVATSAWCAGRALDAGITTVRDVGGARTTVFETAPRAATRLRPRRAHRRLWPAHHHHRRPHLVFRRRGGRRGRRAPQGARTWRSSAPTSSR